MKIEVPICNYCGKPHYGRSNVEDRCICDTSGNFHYGEIDEEYTCPIHGKRVKELEDRINCKPAMEKSSGLRGEP